MSKSRGNVVDPGQMIEKYGADALRVCILFAAPPEAEFDWNERGMDGAWRFLNRIWNFVQDLKSLKENGKFVDTFDFDKKLLFRMHSSIKKVTAEMQGGFKFNTAISSMMELSNEITSAFKTAKEKNSYSPALENAIKNLVLLLSPIAAHICDEMLQILGNEQSSVRTEWPQFDPAALKQDEVTIVVQVNNKVRARILVSSDSTEEQLREIALSNTKIKEWVADKPIKKFFVVKGKLINIVV